MFKKKEKASTSSRSSGKPTDNLAAQLGLFDVSSISELESLNASLQDHGNDEALEAELAALLGGDSSPKLKPKPRTKGGASMVEIDSMVADAMSDKNRVESDHDDLENDDELLAEFQVLVADSGPSPAKQPSPDTTLVHQPSPQDKEKEEYKTDLISIVAERLDNYHAAIANAKANGDDSKARRYSRGLEQVKAIDKKLKSGKTVDPGDIPPPVIVGKPPPANDPPVSPPKPVEEKRAPSPKHVEELRPPPSISSPIVSHNVSPGPSSKPNIKSDSRYIDLSERGEQYKQAAIQAKMNNDLNTAKEYLMISKQFEMVLKDFELSGDVDLSDMPPPPPGFGKQQAAMQSSSTTEDISQPKNAIEALQQRLAKYKQTMSNAEAENNPGKARRMGRIVKQYEDAKKKKVPTATLR